MNYENIINLPRPEPKCRPRMAIEKRAAQFAPFAALTGYEELVKKTARAHEEKINPPAVSSEPSADGKEAPRI